MNLKIRIIFELQHLISILTRDGSQNYVKINAGPGPGHLLQILVENQGRQSGATFNESKGIIGDVQ